MHAKRYRRHGDASISNKVRSLSLDERAHKIDKTGECWLWTGATDGDGYGKVRQGERLFSVHRLAYEQWVGPIPEGMVVCHTCDVTNCCNPAHLWLGTSAENTADKMAKGRWSGGRPKKEKV
jgi:hypothetical protein